MATAWLDEREPGVCSSRAASAARSGRRAAAASSSSPRRGTVEIVERYCDCAFASAKCTREPRALAGGKVERSERFRPDLTSWRRPAARRARAARGRFLLGAPLSSLRRGRGSLSGPPSGPTSTPSSRSRCRTRNWNVDQAPRRDVEHPVDLPLGQHRRVARCAPPPSRRTSAGAPASARTRALLDRALEPLLPHRDVEARLAQRVPERAELCQ